MSWGRLFQRWGPKCEEVQKPWVFAVEALDFEHARVWPPKDDCRQPDGQKQHMYTQTVLQATRRSKPAHGHPNCAAGNQTVKSSTWTPKLSTAVNCNANPAIFPQYIPPTPLTQTAWCFLLEALSNLCRQSFSFIFQYLVICAFLFFVLFAFVFLTENKSKPRVCGRPWNGDKNKMMNILLIEVCIIQTVKMDTERISKYYVQFQVNYEVKLQVTFSDLHSLQHKCLIGSYPKWKNTTFPWQLALLWPWK